MLTAMWLLVGLAGALFVRSELAQTTRRDP